MEQLKTTNQTTMTPTEFGKKPTTDIIWSILDQHLHLVFKRHELGTVMFPLIVLRRMDCMLHDVNDKVRASYEQFHRLLPEDKLDLVLRKAAGNRRFYNTSRFTLVSLLDDAPNLTTNFKIYLGGFNHEVQEIFRNFAFEATFTKLVRNKLLYPVLQAICEYDFRTETVTDHEMGTFFEEIIRLANESNGETAGEHFTPRDAIKLMCAIMFRPDAQDLRRSDIIRTIYDPTCGTGGMVNIGRNYILDKICEGTEKPNIKTFGQELNEVAYAIAKSEALITESDLDNIRLGDTLTNDHFERKHFDYQMANPPYGIHWSKEKEDVINESFDPCGRFSAGLPRINDGQLLFLQHMIHHMAPSGGKIGVVTNGSPLFSGAADSGESNIRKWIIENDWLDCIIALPKDMFYNTPISTYIWILSNRKPAERKGKVQLINAVDMCKPLLKSMGNKRNDISEHIDEIYKLYAEFKETENSKIFKNSDFGYLVLSIEQPLRDENGKLVLKAKKVQPDAKKRDTETVPLDADIEQYFKTEVLPHIDKEAWIDYSKTKIGYEINFTRYFYQYQQPESTAEIFQRMTAVNPETGLTPQQELQQLLTSIFEG